MVLRSSSMIRRSARTPDTTARRYVRAGMLACPALWSHGIEPDDFVVGQDAVGRNVFKKREQFLRRVVAELVAGECLRALRALDYG